MFSWILSQILTVIEYGLLGASYLAKNRKAVVVLDIASMACGIFAFLLLGADLGMAMSVIVLLANFYYLWEESSSRITSSDSSVRGSSTSSTASLRASNLPRTSSKISSSQAASSSRKVSSLREKQKSKQRERQEMIWRSIVLAVVLIGIGIVTWLTYDGPLSLLSVVATVLYEISIWQKSTKVYKFLGVPVAVCWMLYNGFVNSPFGVLCEFVMFITSIVGYVREVRARKKVQVGKKNTRSKKDDKVRGSRNGVGHGSGKTLTTKTHRKKK